MAKVRLRFRVDEQTKKETDNIIRDQQSGGAVAKKNDG